MKKMIFPDLFRGHVTAFFTGKDPGADPDSLSRAIEIRKEDIYLPIQKHTDKVIVVGPLREPMIADAVITREKGLLIGVQVADCVPILIHEKEKGIIGAVHAGWRGTAEGMVKNAIRTITDNYMGSSDALFVAAGPSIRKCCYVVGFDVFDAVRKATGDGDFFSLSGGKYYLDLAAANKYQAVAAGVPEENIWISDDCTHCNPDAYFSYRYAKGPTGRQGGFIMKTL